MKTAGKCPHCGYEFARHTHFEDESAKPAHNSLSICVECGACAIFNADLSLRKMADEEFVGLPPDVLKEIFRIQKALRLVREKAAT